MASIVCEVAVDDGDIDITISHCGIVHLVVSCKATHFATKATVDCHKGTLVIIGFDHCRNNTDSHIGIVTVGRVEHLTEAIGNGVGTRWGIGRYFDLSCCNIELQCGGVAFNLGDVNITIQCKGRTTIVGIVAGHIGDSHPTFFTVDTTTVLIVGDDRCSDYLYGDIGIITVVRVDVVTHCISDSVVALRGTCGYCNYTCSGIEYECVCIATDYGDVDLMTECNCLSIEGIVACDITDGTTTIGTVDTCSVVIFSIDWPRVDSDRDIGFITVGWVDVVTESIGNGVGTISCVPYYSDLPCGSVEIKCVCISCHSGDVCLGTEGEPPIAIIRVVASHIGDRDNIDDRAVDLLARVILGYNLRCDHFDGDIGIVTVGWIEVVTEGVCDGIVALGGTCGYGDHPCGLVELEFVIIACCGGDVGFCTQGEALTVVAVVACDTTVGGTASRTVDGTASIIFGIDGRHRDHDSSVGFITVGRVEHFTESVADIVGACRCICRDSKASVGVAHGWGGGKVGIAREGDIDIVVAYECAIEFVVGCQVTCCTASHTVDTAKCGIIDRIDRCGDDGDIYIGCITVGRVEHFAEFVGDAVVARFGVLCNRDCTCCSIEAQFTVTTWYQ